MEASLASCIKISKLLRNLFCFHILGLNIQILMDLYIILTRESKTLKETISKNMAYQPTKELMRIQTPEFLFNKGRLDKKRSM